MLHNLLCSLGLEKEFVCLGHSSCKMDRVIPAFPMKLEGSDGWQGSREGRTRGTAARRGQTSSFSASRCPKDNTVVREN